MKSLITDVLTKSAGLPKDEVERLLEIPPSSELGDYAFPCFALSKQLKKSPSDIARELVTKISSNLDDIRHFSDVKAAGPYVNFFMNKSEVARKVVSEVLKLKEKYGREAENKGKTIVMDLSSPNIAKPFGIGHLRSTIIGESVCRTHEFLGGKAVRINYLGDWGTQFGKLIFGFKKWGSMEELKKDPIVHLLKIYVEANKEDYEDGGRAYFRKLEEGDKECLKLWKLFRELSLKEFDKIYSLLGSKFDLVSGESFYNKAAKEAVNELKKKNLLVESEDGLIVDLKNEGLGAVLIQKKDGAALYVTRDIAAAIDRHKKFKADILMYEVGQEQALHFKQLFRVLELMGFFWAKNCVHIKHGLYLDSDGKKFATRKGKVVFMSDIADETISLAKNEIKSRFPELKNKELEERAKKIGMAAIIYGDLKNYRENDMVFDLDRFIKFEGNTGPYLQYSYARASSILRKAGDGKAKKSKGKLIISNIEKSEFALIKFIDSFKDIVSKAHNSLDPSIIANYSYDLAKSFNDFYQECQVIGSDCEGFRLSLVGAFRIVMKNSLWLLGIQAIEEM